MARRSNNEGSIYKRADGLWAGAITLPGGKRKVVYGKSRQGVGEALIAALRDVQLGILLPTADARQTLGQFLTHWLEEVVKPNLRPKTYVTYRDVCHLHIIPALGSRRLTKLSPQELITFYHAELEQGFSPRMVGHIHRVLHRSLEDAVRWQLIPRNVCGLVDSPRVSKVEMKALNAEEARRFLEAAQGEPMEALFVLALTTGMRQGELLGLKWADMDMIQGIIHVRRSLARITGKGFVEQEPKTAKGRRTISLTPMATQALQEYRRRQLEARLLAGGEWEDRNLVFCNALGRPMEVTNLIRRHFHPLLKKAGLPRVRFHDLRHSCASLLLSMNAHPKVVQELLGHSTISVTMDTYSHTVPSLQVEAVNGLDKLLRGR
ncbi:MAG: site-specific integrase [Chloroflexi bacterium]|nr:site-specific integrase [Chloroflexota bacterium]